MKVVIITGGGSGIGAATAKKLTARGDAVCIAGRNETKLMERAAELRRAGGEICHHQADVSRPHEAQDLISKAVQWKGRIDAVINCAGAAPMLPVSELSDQQWRDILDINLSSVFYMTRSVWPVFKKQYDALTEEQRATHDAGVIINISSAAARDPFPGLGAYGAAKAAVNLLTTATAREGRDIAVRVIAIAPGAVETSMFRALPIASKVPARDILDPDSVADAIVAALDGGVWCSSGETLYIRRRCL
jgi:NAD(P)-dependent dehydrogenase (short-subunit alcohol dehydrogenase family)